MVTLPKAGTDVQHPGPIDDVVLEVSAGAVVDALARFELLLGLWIVPWFGRLGREVEELFLDCFFLGCKQLGGSDGVSGGSILPLELLMLHHQQNLGITHLLRLGPSSAVKAVGPIRLS